MTYSSNAQAYGVSVTGVTLISDISSSNSYYMRIYQATGTSVTISTTVTSGGVGIFKVS